MTAASSRPAVSADSPPAADQDLRALFGQSLALFADFDGPEHVLHEANPAFLAALGRTGVDVGAPIAGLLDASIGRELLGALDAVYRTGEPSTGRDIRVVVGAAEQARDVFFDFAFEPRRDAEGAVIGTRVIGVETTQIKHAQRLTAEQRALLEQIARDAPLSEVLDGMARSIEVLAPDQVLVSVLLADPDGLHLRHGAAPSLPEFYNRAIDGIATGEAVGSCGTAAHRRVPVIVTDIGTDPFWDDFRGLAEEAGLAACWSTPILGRDGSLLGTFAMYHRVPRTPQDSDLALARLFADTASLAIERHHIEQAKLDAEARAVAARDELARAMRAEQRLRAEAEERASAAAELAAAMRTAAATHAARPHPEHCQLGGAAGCTEPAELKIADSWGDSAWGCLAHVEEAMFSVRTVFIASEELGGLLSYVNR
ncbi:GAF domain-containing protein [Nocardia jejuensis]|uniref:GAF domain-containing protein n=1 Tax=Nocardia jejuensis TaxID=328049 RepID=UPI000836C879|nr:GAF domain-containing protein [Nocardia jejuensis]